MSLFLLFFTIASSLLNWHPHTLSPDISPCRDLKIQLVKLIPSHILLSNQCSLFQVTLHSTTAVHCLAWPDFRFTSPRFLLSPDALHESDTTRSLLTLMGGFHKPGWNLLVSGWQLREQRSNHRGSSLYHYTTLCQGEVMPGAEEESPEGDKRSKAVDSPQELGPTQ